MHIRIRHALRAILIVIIFTSALATIKCAVSVFTWTLAPSRCNGMMWMISCVWLSIVVVVVVMNGLRELLSHSRRFIRDEYILFFCRVKIECLCCTIFLSLHTFTIEQVRLKSDFFCFFSLNFNFFSFSLLRAPTMAEKLRKNEIFSRSMMRGAHAVIFSIW